MTLSYRSGPAWIVLYVEPRCEMAVSHALQAAGYATYLPTESLIVRRRRRDEEIARPLFSRYCFVSLDLDLQEWSPLKAIDGVCYILRNDGRPSRVPTAWIEMLKRAEQYGEYDRTRDAPNGFELNELIRIGEGPFAGHHALIKEFVAKLRSSTARKRVKVLLDFLGRMTEIELPVVALEKI